jgi:hypothetical protein
MTRPDALLDAALTVQRWQRQFPPSQHWRATHYIAHRLDCYPAWGAIEEAILLRLIAEDEPLRLAA